MSFMKFSIPIFLIMIILSSCNGSEENHSEDEGTHILQENGFSIVKDIGTIETYVLKKSKLTELPYMVIWGLQNKDVTPYLNKEVTSKGYLVTHNEIKEKLNLTSKNSIKAILMNIDEQYIGAYLIVEDVVSKDGTGNIYAISGDSLEEVTKQDLDTWRKEWLSKYKPT